jgi:3-hydroxyacyl-CoA dehydrogenase
MADNTTVAVLGTGIMGAAMARNLLEAGMEVRVWNRTREKAEPLADDSARVAEGPAEAAEEGLRLAVSARFADAIEAGHGEEDMAAVYRAAGLDRGYPQTGLVPGCEYNLLVRKT